MRSIPPFELIAVVGLASVLLTGCDDAPAPPGRDAEPAQHDEAPPVIHPFDDSEFAEEPVDEASRAKLADVLRERDLLVRTRRLAELLTTLGPEAVSAVRATFYDGTLEFGATEYELLVHFWALHDPDQATRWAVDRAPAPVKSVVVTTALMQWAAADPRAAADAGRYWFTRHPDIANIIPSAIVRGWYAGGETPGLLLYIKNMGMGIPRQRAIGVYIREKIRNEGTEAAQRWVESMTDDEEAFVLSIHRQTAVSLAVFDTDAAVRWCDEECDGPKGKSMRSLIARIWVRSDAPKAMAWLATAPAGYERSLAVRAAYSVWLRRERARAMRWMAAQTTEDGTLEPWLESTRAVYARALADEDPPAAIAWALPIDKDDERQATLKRIVEVWRASDPEAAEAWVRKNAPSTQSEAPTDAPAGAP